jgi:glutaredoxin
MSCIPSIAGGLCMAAICVFAGSALAQERQVYRYVDADGRVVYSDRAPTGTAKDVQTKRVWGNTIETSTTPVAVQQAADRFPVTLYTFACGETCDKATGLLNRRGVPYSTINIEEGENAAKLQALTGDMSAPVLQVGDKLVAQGFSEGQWNQLLDQAGYPKMPPKRTATPLGGRPADEPAPVPVRAAGAR